MSNTLLEVESVAAHVAGPTDGSFVDRRREKQDGLFRERRQFTNSHDGLTDEAGELARAIDSYKARHRRRFINYEEMLAVVKSLGYSR
jgi:hypothetical protein